MRTSLLVACGSVSLVAAGIVVACAAPGAGERDEQTRALPDGGGGKGSLTDGERSDADTAEESSVDAPSCSEAGWCVTVLPDADLLMKDIWPLLDHAFAIAESPTLGVKVLEWDEEQASWKYIDDGTQNDSGLGRWAGRIWAPSENEVYYGVSPGYVYHGIRSESAWLWARFKLGSGASADPDDGNPSYWKRDGAARTPALGVWGTSSDDVYAWFKNIIYHWSSVGGSPPEWVAEYVAADTDAPPPTEQLFFFGAAGTSPEDIWFSGARSRTLAGCALVVRKTSIGYLRIADGVVAGTDKACTVRAGTLMIAGTEGWLTDIQSLGANQFVGLKGAHDVARITVEGDRYSIALAPVPTAISFKGLNSLSTALDDLWLGGAGLVLRGGSVWDGGVYEISTLALSGAPLNRPIYQVRGTASNNLWAIGVRYALHKTTP